MLRTLLLWVGLSSPLAAGPVAAAQPPAGDLTGVRSLVQEQPKAALDLLEQVRPEARDSDEGLLLHGLILAALQDFADAESVFERLTRRCPSNVVAYNNLIVSQALRRSTSNDIPLDLDFTVQESGDRQLEVLQRNAAVTASMGRQAADPPDRDLEVELLRGEPGFQCDNKTVASSGVAQQVAQAEAPVSREAPAGSSEEAPKETVAAIASPSVASEPADTTASSTLDRQSQDSGRTREAALSLDQAQALINGWALAWQERRVDAYLSYYSSTFRPSNGSSRTEWARLRRERIETPASIEVTVQDPRVETESTDRVRVVFRQSYRSDRFQDRGTKRIELLREGESWKIVRETFRPEP